ncbi:MAG: hypothetical protein AVDCRST_MAG73-2932 [uncultured Thermomicrobiales bacterium]|uniref:Inositolphosphotransferase Aur1/Ipt1 domain-containing protein n=1 Tax=uncultured Thermomicrobiales bacterium TaxID=1645740 RepID=A0A6J4UHS4_9BACT|nr:MAG: hypothetical protein AVDCRST_MAG73-2932 [uncultured Thermomicrobiales bacterium]
MTDQRDDNPKRRDSVRALGTTGRDPVDAPIVVQNRRHNPVLVSKDTAPVVHVGAEGHLEADEPPRFPWWRWRPNRKLGIRIAIATALIVASVLTNRSYLGWGLFVIFAILVVPMGRARSFLLAFIPYAGVWFVFTFLRSLADETLLANTVNTNVATFERWLFDGQLPSITLQDRLFDPARIQWYDYFCTMIHWSYFFVPHVVAIRLWQKNPALLRRYLSAMTLLLTVGLFIYFLIPTNPPWLAREPFDSPAAATVRRVMEPVAEQLGGGLYSASYRVIGESNAIAAMPSIHMAITFLLVFPAWSVRGAWRWLALAYAALMGYSLVYLGEHYVVDVVAGMIVTAYGWYAAGSWIDKVAPVVGQWLPSRRPAGAPSPLVETAS